MVWLWKYSVGLNEMEIDIKNVDSTLNGWANDFDVLANRTQEEAIKQFISELENGIRGKLESGITIIGEDKKPRRAIGDIKVEVNPDKISFKTSLTGDMGIVEYGDAHNKPQPIVRSLIDSIVQKLNA